MMEEPIQPVAIFDFDGTITRKSTTVSFLKFIYGPVLYAKFAGNLHALILYYCNLMDIDQLNKLIAHSFFKNIAREVLLHKGEQFCENIIPALIRKGALQRINWHKEQGHYCILATSAYNLYIDYWAAAHNFDNCVSTKIAFNEQDKATGALDGKSCYGEEKLRRVLEVIGTEPRTIYSYGDSGGDKAILDYATHPYYRLFK